LIKYEKDMRTKTPLPKPHFLFFLLLILGFSISGKLSAQDPEILSVQDPEIWYNSISIPPSPNAATFAKYGDIPVNKSTGIPSISIPIVMIQDAGIALPISLSYHAGGIQVQENASWVGLGWVINCGGVISRQMNGLPDEKTNGYLEVANRVPSASAIDIELADPMTRDDAYFMLEHLTTGLRDYEPDQFNYSFGDYNGSFHFSNNMEPITLQAEMLNIEPIFDTDDIIGFKVIDSNGIIYYFGVYEGKDCTEYTNVEVGGVDPPDYISSWYLNKIINPRSNAVIELFYETHYYTQSVNYSQTILYEAVGTNYSQVGSQLNSCITTIPDAKYLSKIKFDNGEVQFWNSQAYGNNRKLDSIKWTNYAVNRIFYFEYGHFQFNRLKLLSFKEKSGINEIKHSFEYNTPDLPVQTSYSQDYWGYYNGKNNSSMVPKLEFGTQSLGSGDRSPSLTHSLACSLKKIYYPTGGYTLFEYELNSYSRSVTPEDIGIYESESVSVTGSGPHREVCEFSDIVPFNSGLMACANNSADDIFYSPNNHPGGMSATSIPLLTGQYNYYDVRVNAEVSISDMNSYNPGFHYGKVYLVDNTTQSTTLLAQVRYDNPVSLALNNLDYSHSYSLKVCANGSITTTWAEISYKKYDPDDLQGSIPVPSGGLRIKKITSYDPGTGQSMYKTFDYAESGYTTSYHPGPDRYYTLTKHIHHLMFGEVDITNGIMLYSTPPSGSIGRIAYNKVIEYTGTSTNNTGKIETLFYSAPDLGHSGIPYPPVINNAWMRSKVISERVYEYNPSTQAYRRIIQKDYEYDFDPRHLREIRGFKATRVQTHSLNGGILMFDYSNDFYFENYTIVSNCFHLINEITTELPSNGDSIVVSKDYYYDNPRHTLPTRIQYYDSKGDLVETTNKYSLDFVTCTENCIETDSAYNECKAAYLNCLAAEYAGSSGTLQGALFMAIHNIINPVIEQIIKINHVETEHVYRNYEVKDSYRLVLSSICRKTNGILNTETVFNNHDLKGNPVEVKAREDGLTTSYIWGYNNTYPTVKADNANYTDIAYTGFEENGVYGGWTFESGNRLKSYARTGRYSCVNAIMQKNVSVNSIVSLWVKSGGGTPTISGYTPKVYAATNGWIYYEWNVNPGSIRVYCSNCYIDDLRLYPVGVSMTTYTYDPLIGMTSQTDANGETTYYEYDSFGRLKNVRDNDGKITARNYYHYYNDTSSDTPYLNTSPTSMSFGSGASSSSLTITSNSSWSITDNASWLSVNTTSGTGNATVSVSVTANISAARNATITITYAGGLTKTVLVSQAAGSTSTLLVSPMTINFGYIAPPQTLTITSNTSWTVTKSASWITISATSGTGNGTITVAASKLLTGTRSGTVTFKTTDNTVTRIVNVYQDSGLQQ